MLRYVEKLTRTPNRIDRKDVEQLGRAGFTDSAVLDICQVTAYYAFVNRLAGGLGVELEPAGENEGTPGERNRKRMEH
jgi:alkylhydroperoxidase family enzyme